MENINENLKKLEEKIDSNTTRMIENMNKLHNHEKMINDNSNKIQKNSYALSILRDYKKGLIGWRIVAGVFIVLWVITVGYLVYILNDIGTVEETITQENESGYNNYIGNNGDIYNGETNNQN